VAGCSRSFNLRTALAAHLSDGHHPPLTPAAYAQTYGSRGECYGQYACRLCGASIAHKYNNIASHVTLIHDLTIGEYEARFHAPPPQQQQQPQQQAKAVEEEDEDEEDHYVIDEDGGKVGWKRFLEVVAKTKTEIAF
jgi:hypothetical protein